MTRPLGRARRARHAAGGRRPRPGRAPYWASPRIETAGIEIVRDGDGIALGGIRSPRVEVPVDVLSGIPGPDPSLICQLLGSTVALAPERIRALYPAREEYLARYTTATDRLIAEGFALAEDREALLAYARPDRIS